MQFNQHLAGKGTKPKRNWLHNKGCIKELLYGWLDCSSAARIGKEAARQDTVSNGTSALQLLPGPGSSTSSKLPGLHWKRVNISPSLDPQKSQGSKAFSAQKPIPHLQYQLRCEETQHKGLTLATAKSHTSLLNFRAQQPIVKFWQLMLGQHAKILLPTLATSKEIYDPAHIAEGWETRSSMTL